MTRSWRSFAASPSSVNVVTPRCGPYPAGSVRGRPLLAAQHARSWPTTDPSLAGLLPRVDMYRNRRFCPAGFLHSSPADAGENCRAMQGDDDDIAEAMGPVHRAAASNDRLPAARFE